MHMQLHFIIVPGLRFEQFKQVSNIVLDQQRTTQNAHDLVDGSADITMRNSDIREFPETPTTKQLTKHQNLQVTPMRERPTASMIVVLDCKTFEESFGKKPRDLSENILPLMHLCSIFELGAKVCISKVRQDFQEVKLCA